MSLTCVIIEPGFAAKFVKAVQQRVRAERAERASDIKWHSWGYTMPNSP